MKKILTGLLCGAVSAALLLSGCAIMVPDNGGETPPEYNEGDNPDPPPSQDRVDWMDINGDIIITENTDNTEGSDSSSNGSGSADGTAGGTENDDNAITGSTGTGSAGTVTGGNGSSGNESGSMVSGSNTSGSTVSGGNGSGGSESNGAESGGDEAADPEEGTAGSGDITVPGNGITGNVSGGSGSSGSNAEEGDVSGGDVSVGDVSGGDTATGVIPEGANIRVGVMLPAGSVLNTEEWLNSFTLASSGTSLVLDTDGYNAVSGDVITFPTTQMFDNETGNSLDVIGWYYVYYDGSVSKLVHSGGTLAVMDSGNIMPCFTQAASSTLVWDSEGYLYNNQHLQQGIASISNAFNTTYCRDELKIETTSTKWFRLKGEERITDDATYDVTYTVTNYDHKAVTLTLGVIESGYTYEGGHYFTDLNGELCQTEITLQPGESETISWTYVATRPATGAARTHFITGIETSDNNLDTDGRLHLGLIIDHAKHIA